MADDVIAHEWYEQINPSHNMQLLPIIMLMSLLMLLLYKLGLHSNLDNNYVCNDDLRGNLTCS